MNSTSVIDLTYWAPISPILPENVFDILEEKRNSHTDMLVDGGAIHGYEDLEYSQIK